MIRLPGSDTPAPRVYDLYIAGRASALLAVGVRLGVFRHLGATPNTPDELAAALDLAPRGAAALLRSLETLGLTERRDGRHHLTDAARADLLPDAHGSLAGLIDLDFDHPMTPGSLLDAIRSGSQSVYGGGDVWEEHAEDTDAARRFTQAMHSISERPAQALADAWRWGEDVRLLDVGGGSGAYPLALLKRFPRLTAELLDLAPVCAEARRRFRDAGLQDRAMATPGDLFEGAPYPAADVVLFSQIVHDWAPPDCALLFARAAAALQPGGRVLVHEKLVTVEPRPGPVATVLVDLDMLFWTEGKQYTFAEVAAMLEAAGFEDVAVVPTTGYWSVVSARRK